MPITHKIHGGTEINIKNTTYQCPLSRQHCTVLYCTVLYCTVLYGLERHQNEMFPPRQNRPYVAQGRNAGTTINQIVVVAISRYQSWHPVVSYGLVSVCSPPIRPRPRFPPTRPVLLLVPVFLVLVVVFAHRGSTKPTLDRFQPGHIRCDVLTSCVSSSTTYHALSCSSCCVGSIRCTHFVFNESTQQQQS